MTSPALGGKILVRPNVESWGSFGESILDHVVVLDALDALEVGQNTIRTYPANSDTQQSTVTVFFQVFAPPHQMLIFGAVDFTAALVRVAKTLDYRVTVCDARPCSPQRRDSPKRTRW
jgi:xanthine dehydrogenase accessory factor